MKKIITIILVLSMTLGLCACGGTAGADGTAGSEGGSEVSTGLQVGYNRQSIMPEGAVPLGGYGNGDTRISDGYLDILYATCIAMTQGEETVLLFTQDLLRSTGSWVADVRLQIFEKTGIPADHIMICATHTHSAPDTTSNDPRITAYKELYVNAMVAAAEAALADRAATTLYGAKTDVEDMNFVRHYKLANDTYAGDNFGDFGSADIVDHATEKDPEMLLVKMDREGDKQDILLMNWQAHPCFTGSSSEVNISADFVGTTRQAVEADTGMLFAYFTGDAGNHNVTSKISDENHGLDVKDFGKALAQCAQDALSGMQKLEGDGIKTAQLTYEYAVNHDKEDMQTQAKEVVDLWTSTGNKAAADALAKQYGFSSVFEANSVTYRQSRPATATMELNAMYIAGMAFITAPYEMFSDSGIYIKENSPFDMTMVFTCSNNAHGYFATEAAYDYGCYESETSYFAKGCAEAAAEQFVNMLKGLQ